MAAFERESQAFKRAAHYLSHSSQGKRESLKSFRYGMAQRIRERLLEMQAARDQDLKAAGRDLVRVVGAVVSRAFAQAYPHLESVAYQERPYNARAYQQGVVASGRVGLHPGVKAGAPPLQLGP